MCKAVTWSWLKIILIGNKSLCRFLRSQTGNIKSYFKKISLGFFVQKGKKTHFNGATPVIYPPAVPQCGALPLQVFFWLINSENVWEDTMPLNAPVLVQILKIMIISSRKSFCLWLLYSHKKYREIQEIWSPPEMLHKDWKCLRNQ